MFASFVGSPASGKTTTAALTFASFKELGVSCEWIPESARSVIANIRTARGLKPRDPLKLSDAETISIMRQQFAIEQDMYLATGNEVFLLADGSVLNSLLYLPAAVREQDQVKNFALTAAKNYDVIFYCPPVRQQNQFDPNRVHSLEESRAIDAEAKLVLSGLGRQVKAPIIALVGSPTDRASTVKNYLMYGGR